MGSVPRTALAPALHVGPELGPGSRYCWCCTSTVGAGFCDPEHSCRSALALCPLLQVHRGQKSVWPEWLRGHQQYLDPGPSPTCSAGARAVLGIEPRTSHTLNENHATRPNSQLIELARDPKNSLHASDTAPPGEVAK